MFGDFILTRPTYSMSKEIALWSSENHAYSYICNYSSITPSKFYPNLPKWAGLTNGTELSFVWQSFKATSKFHFRRISIEFVDD